MKVSSTFTLLSFIVFQCQEEGHFQRRTHKESKAEESRGGFRNKNTYTFTNPKKKLHDFEAIEGRQASKQCTSQPPVFLNRHTTVVSS